MDPNTLRREIEQLEEDLRQSAARLGDEAWIQRSMPLLVEQERAQLRSLTAQLEHLRNLLASSVPTEQGGLSSPYVGTWVPLPLYERAEDPKPSPPDTAPEHVSVPLTAPIGANTRQELSQAIAEACLLRARPWKAVAALAAIRQRCGNDIPTLRLLAAALTGLHKKLERMVRARLTALCVDSLGSPRELEAVPRTAAAFSRSHELPDADDGLTRLQRLVLSVMRELAPATGPFVAVPVVASEAKERDATVNVADVEHSLALLCNPLLRTYPLVEGRGLTALRIPSETRVSRVRLADFAEEYLSGAIALPLLLVNGAESAGTILRGHNPGELLVAALVLLENSDSDLREVLHGPDFPTGGVLHLHPLRDLRCQGATTLRLRAATEVRVDRQTSRGRIIITGLPLPLLPGDIVQGIEALRASGHLGGVTSIRDESTSEHAEILVELEHIAFSEPVLRALLASRLLEQTLEADFRVCRNTEPVTLPLDTLLRHFIDQRRERVRARLRATLEQSRERAALAEAVVVALELLEPVQAALRSTCDDEEAVAALMNFIVPAHRAALPPGCSHAYERGFTEAQARHLLKQRRLASRPREPARRDWVELTQACRQAETILESKVEITQEVREELMVACARFDAARRTRLEFWD